MTTTQMDDYKAYQAQLDEMQEIDTARVRLIRLAAKRYRNNLDHYYHNRLLINMMMMDDKNYIKKKI